MVFVRRELLKVLDNRGFIHVLKVENFSNVEKGDKGPTRRSFTVVRYFWPESIEVARQKGDRPISPNVLSCSSLSCAHGQSCPVQFGADTLETIEAKYGSHCAQYGNSHIDHVNSNCIRLHGSLSSGHLHQWRGRHRYRQQQQHPVQR